MTRPIRRLAFCLLFVVATSLYPILLFGQTGPDAALEEEAQKHYLNAMQLYDSGQHDGAAKELALAEKAVRKFKDKARQKSTLETIKDAQVGVLCEAGHARFRTESYDKAFEYFNKCMSAMDKKDKRRRVVEKNLAQSAYMSTMQLWLNKKFETARERARDAQLLVQRTYPDGDSMRTRLDDIHRKIVQVDTEMLVSRGEIERAYGELKKDFAIQEDPTFAYKLGELGAQLRLYSEAEMYYSRARTSAEKALAGGSRVEELTTIVSDSQDRIGHIRSLRRTIVVRSNVPFYQVELLRTTSERPIAQQEVEDPIKGVTFEVYPGRYNIKVINADFGVCNRENVPLNKEDIEIVCDYDKPPTAVSFDTNPRGVKVKVVPSTMVASQRTPFYTQLHRGAYTLLAEVEGFPDPVEIPFVVEHETQQDFVFDLDYAELDINLPDEHTDAVVRLDGKPFDVFSQQLPRLGIGSHTIEVEKPGYETVVQRVFMSPRETKTIFIELKQPEVLDPDQVYTPPALDIGVGYRGEFLSYEALRDTGSGVLSRSGDYVLHHVTVDTNIYLTRNERATLKPYVHIGADLGFAVSKPIQSIFSATVQAGFGLLMDQIDQSAWRAELNYQFGYYRWNDEFPSSQFDLSTLHPLGLSLHGDGHYQLLQASLDVGFSTGSGRRDDYAAKCSTDTAFTWIDAEAFVGADIVDAISYNKNLDAVIGAFGGILAYSEEQKLLAGGCNGVGPQGLEVTDGLVGARFKFRYVTVSSPKTAFNLQGDLRFVGGISETAPVIYDDKTDFKATFGNFSLRAGLELLF
ncbi:MAG: hypothetical protein HUU55_02890 [Myxococcales bacterium]|nr:hypothetical protein [Myxococcales bacterium]